ncbi:hypothetical protein, partial [Bacteroides pyogenes]|uniref:hypothetical protein n=1 Tax=Bacteroides pyogenes TaxID=310300 RepID=UPI001CA32AB9
MMAAETIIGKFQKFPFDEGGVSKCTPLFLCTKPRLSQAGALLLPKDFVSLSITFYTMTKI